MGQLTQSTVETQDLLDDVPNKAETAADVGLSNVDNTADLDKPVSTATQHVIDNLDSATTKNVKDFGLIGNGITDDTVALQALLDSLPNGGSIYFPIGTYPISSVTYTFQKSLTILGETSGQQITTRVGTVLKNTTAQPIFNLGSATTNHAGHNIKNIVLDGDGIAGASGLYVRQTNSSHLERLLFIGYSDITSFPLFFDGNINFCVTNTVSNCKSYKCYNAIKAYRNTSLHVIGGYYTGMGNTIGIGIDSGDEGDTLEVLGVHIDGFGVAVRNNILGSSITGRFEGNGIGVQVGALSDKCKIALSHFDIRNGGASSIGVDIIAGARRTQLALNGYSKDTEQVKVSDLGSFTTNLDEIPLIYDSDEAKVTLTSGTAFAAPFVVEDNECEVHLISDNVSNGRQYRLRSRSNGVFDIYNHTDGKEIIKITKDGVIIHVQYTVATLPTVILGGGIFVTDDTGGPTKAWSDGINWMRVSDNVIISA